MSRNKLSIVEEVLARTYKMEQMPFSRFGSYMVIDFLQKGGKKRLYIRDIHGGDLEDGAQFEIEIYHHEKKILKSQLEFHQTATQLTISDRNSPDAKIRFCMPEPGQIMAIGEGLNLKLIYEHKRYDSIYLLEDGSYELTSYSKEIKYRIRDFGSGVLVNAPWNKIGSDGIDLYWKGNFEWVISSYKVVDSAKQCHFTNYDQGYCKVVEDYSKWIKQAISPQCEALYAQKSVSQRKRIQEAILILWMNFVSAEGLMKRPAMYMTKHYMTNIWSWDNCFGAIALADLDKTLAWDQLMMFCDHQHDSGVYPDYVNDQYASFSSTKPPIYYWAYKIMCEKNIEFCSKEYLEPFYETTKRNTEFWLNERMTKLGLPCYRHGNDSGWDNGTFYQKGVPVITPDLAAFLIYQIDGLQKMAYRLDRWTEAHEWRLISEQLLEKLTHLLWSEKNKKFVAIHVPSCEVVHEGDTLQAFLPIILADRLPAEISNHLVEGLMDENRFLCQFGLATESKSSDFFRYNGYWRGPIWAPVTLLMIDSLKRANHINFSQLLRTKWLRLIEKSGFYENFDPETGEGLVDPAFAWTASVYLHLLNEPIS